MSLKILALPKEMLRCAALLLLAVFLVGAASVPKTGAQAPERLIALGDLHGDYDAFLALMSEAGLIDSAGRWSGEKTVLVQMGDVVDRGARSRDIILHLQRLQNQARRAGGKVIALIGNHEAMNMIGDLRYVPQAEYQNYVTPYSEALRQRYYRENKRRIEAGYRQSTPDMPEADIKVRWLEQTPLGFIEHRRAWAPSGAIGRWVLADPALVIIGDSLFVHGGISAKYVAYSVAELNDRVHGALRSQAREDSNILEDEAGPLWYRGLVDENENTEREVAAVLQAYAVKRLIIAHTPSLSGIKVLHQGRVILIDTGISAVYGGTRSFLNIEGKAILAHDNGRVSEVKSAQGSP
jgi:hypothetical protein